MFNEEGVYIYIYILKCLKNLQIVVLENLAMKASLVKSKAYENWLCI